MFITFAYDIYIVHVRSTKSISRQMQYVTKLQNTWIQKLQLNKDQSCRKNTNEQRLKLPTSSSHFNKSLNLWTLPANCTSNNAISLAKAATSPSAKAASARACSASNTARSVRRRISSRVPREGSLHDTWHLVKNMLISKDYINILKHDNLSPFHLFKIFLGVIVEFPCTWLWWISLDKRSSTAVKSHGIS